MSASQKTRLPDSAGGLLTNEECFKLLDIDIYEDNDLLKNFPSVARSEVVYHHEEGSSLYPPSPPEIKPSEADLAIDLLHQLDAPCKQENLFPNWLEEKVELPIFEGISVSGPVAAAVYQPAAHTAELLREFETVFSGVELTHLTPPHSPPAAPAPGPAAQLLLSYAQQAQGFALDPWHVPAIQPVSAPAPAPCYDPVDELVRHRAAHLPSPSPSPSSASGSGSSPPSSPRSSTDDDWPGTTRRKPYTCPHEDRRSRKKEQNKNAATRYRQKKKAEVEVLLGEESSLRQRHSELGDKCSDLQREIRYLKGLMRDLLKAKGLIK